MWVSNPSSAVDSARSPLSHVSTLTFFRCLPSGPASHSDPTRSTDQVGLGTGIWELRSAWEGQLVTERKDRWLTVSVVPSVMGLQSPSGAFISSFPCHLLFLVAYEGVSTLGKRGCKYSSPVSFVLSSPPLVSLSFPLPPFLVLVLFPSSQTVLASLWIFLFLFFFNLSHILQLSFQAFIRKVLGGTSQRASGQGPEASFSA